MEFINGPSSLCWAGYQAALTPTRQGRQSMDTIPQAADIPAEINPFARPQFAKAYPELLDAVSDGAAVGYLWLRMSRFVGYQMAKGWFGATYDELAEAMHCSRRSAVDRVAELEATGWLRVPKRGVPHPGGGRSNMYVLTLEPRELKPGHAVSSSNGIKRSEGEPERSEGFPLASSLEEVPSSGNHLVSSAKFALLGVQNSPPLAPAV